MSAPYTAAVVGAGSGGKLSMRALSVSDRFELVAVADLSETARQEAETLCPGIRTFSTHGEMFARCPTDVVCVSTWPPSHLEVTRDALELPLKGILVEKPLADTAADGHEVLRLVESSGLPLAVPHGLLVADHVIQVLDLVREGRIGELKLVEIQCAGWDVINAGIHWLNFFVVLTEEDPVTWVLAACDATTRTYRDGMQVETLAVTTAQTRSGVRVVMHTGDYVNVTEEGKGTAFRLVGTDGIIEFYGWEGRYRVMSENHPRGRIVEIDPSPRSAHQRHLEALAEQMDKSEPDYAIARSSLQALEICEAAYLSARHGCAVTLPLEAFEVPERTDWDPGIPYSGSGGGRDGRNLPPEGDGG